MQRLAADGAVKKVAGGGVMATCATLTSASVWGASANPVPGLDGVCAGGSDAVVVSPAMYQEYISIKDGTPQGLTSVDALAAFSWGFAAVMLFWSMGWMVSAAVQGIRRI